MTPQWTVKCTLHRLPSLRPSLRREAARTSRDATRVPLIEMDVEVTTTRGRRWLRHARLPEAPSGAPASATVVAGSPASEAPPFAAARIGTIAANDAVRRGRSPFEAMSRRSTGAKVYDTPIGQPQFPAEWPSLR